MISKELITILHDFIKDIVGTFPEYKDSLDPGLQALYTGHENGEAMIEEVVRHCEQVYPERFFDILYQKEEIFKESIFFLPGIDFKKIWTADIPQRHEQLFGSICNLFYFQ